MWMKLVYVWFRTKVVFRPLELWRWKVFIPRWLFSRNLRTRKKTVYALETWTYYMYHTSVAINTRLPAGVSCRRRHSYGEVNGGKRREATSSPAKSWRRLGCGASSGFRRWLGWTWDRERWAWVGWQVGDRNELDYWWTFAWASKWSASWPSKVQTACPIPPLFAGALLGQPRTFTGSTGFWRIDWLFSRFVCAPTSHKRYALDLSIIVHRIYNFIMVQP